VPPRNPNIRLQDIVGAIERILDYTASHSLSSFAADRKTIDAVVRNLEVLGEAARHVDAETMRQLPTLPWREMADLRNLLIHQYFGVSAEIVWATIQRDLVPVRDALRAELHRRGETGASD
jgi:uncharacterized protein with HEPN domain